MIAEIRALDPKPGAELRQRAAAAAGARRADARRRRTAAGCWNSTRKPCRACWSTRRFYARVLPRAAREDKRVPDRTAADRELAGQVAAAARADHPEGRGRNRAPAGRVLPPRRRPSAAADPARHRRRGGDARKHRQPRDRQQIHRDAARHVRAEIFLHHRDRRHRRRKPQRRSGAPPHPRAGRRRNRRRRSCPTTRSWQPCAARAWTSPAGPWPNTAKRCASRARCSASGRRPCRPDGRAIDRRHAGAAGCEREEDRTHADHGFGQAGRSFGRAAHPRGRAPRSASPASISTMRWRRTSPSAARAASSPATSTCMPAAA